MSSRWKILIFVGLFILITHETVTSSRSDNRLKKLLLKRREEKLGGNKNIENTDGKIIFPSDNDDDDEDLETNPPILAPGCENSTFCEDSLNYPSSTIQAALRMNKNLEFFSASDMLPDDAEQRLKFAPDEIPLCNSIEKVVYPRAGKSVRKGWRHIVNERNFVQGIRIEICKNPSESCRLIDTFAQGYTSTCEQKYIFKNLVSVVGGKLELVLHRFPVSCNCYVKFQRGWYSSFGKQRL